MSAGLISSASAQTPTTYQIANGLSSNLTFRAFQCSSGIFCTGSVPIDYLGNPLTGVAGSPSTMGMTIQGMPSGTPVPVTCSSGCSSSAGTGANNADGVAAVSTGLGQNQDYPFLWNGSTFDRWYGDHTNGGWVNVKTSVLPANAAEESGGNLAQLVTDFGAPGATACSTDTASCDLNQQIQRLAQRLTSIVTALGSPFQAGASIGNTSFQATGATSNASSGVATGSSNIPAVAYLYGFNGSTWDQLQTDVSKLLKVNCAAGCSTPAAPSVAGTATPALSVTSTTSRQALGDTSGSFTNLILWNAGSVAVNYNLGNSSVTATTSNTAIPPGGVIQVPQASATNIAAITASSTATLYVIQTSSPMQVAGLSVGGGGSIGTVTQGNAGSDAQAWWAQIGDGTNGPVAVKPASTAPAATDKALVAALSPNTGEVGTPATGVSQPAGGVGLSGWLSSIYNSINSVLSSSGAASKWLTVWVANTTTSLPNNADGIAVQSGAANSPVNSFGYLFNGTSWDRQRSGSITGAALSQQATLFPSSSTPIQASATGTTASTTATLAATSGKTTYICGFSIRANAAAVATGNATVTGPATTMNFTQWTAPNASGLGVTEELFPQCIPASAANTAIAVASAAPGTSGIVSVSAWGYQQ